MDGCIRNIAEAGVVVVALVAWSKIRGRVGIHWMLPDGLLRRLLMAEDDAKRRSVLLNMFMVCCYDDLRRLSNATAMNYIIKWLPTFISMFCVCGQTFLWPLVKYVVHRNIFTNSYKFVLDNSTGHGFPPSLTLLTSIECNAIPYAIKRKGGSAF
jgi:hypothetical protein